MSSTNAVQGSNAPKIDTLAKLRVRVRYAFLGHVEKQPETELISDIVDADIVCVAPFLPRLAGGSWRVVDKAETVRNEYKNEVVPWFDSWSLQDEQALAC